MSFNRHFCNSQWDIGSLHRRKLVLSPKQFRLEAVALCEVYDDRKEKSPLSFYYR